MLPPVRPDPWIIARWASSILAALILCAAPLWLWADPLRWFFLKSDDFLFIADCRTTGALGRHLLEPHFGHFVPLFRLETHLLCRLAGSLEALPIVMAGASYASLVMAMAAVGHLVAHETSRMALGLAAMAAVGLTTVLGTSLLWYSASQALMAGTIIVVMLTALQSWRRNGSWPMFGLAILAAIAAPMFWSAGFAAGPVGLAYLWADGRRGIRRASCCLMVLTLGTAALAWIVAGQEFAPVFHVAHTPISKVLPITAIIAHSSQAICEALVLNNLGLDALTTAGQAVIFVVLLAMLWRWSRGGRDVDGRRSWPRINPLEAAGAALVLVTFGLIFSARGTEDEFDTLRALGWYDAMAELGAVLFVLGWCAGDLPSPPPGRQAPAGRRGLISVLLFAMTMLALQSPRADRMVFVYDEMAGPIGLPGLGVAPLRTPADLEEQARTQRAALAALDRLEAEARRGAVNRDAIRTAVPLSSIPGTPPHLPDFDHTEMLDIPPRDSQSTR